MVRLTAYWGFIVLGAGNTLLGPALLPILADFHVTPSQAGPLFLASSVGYLLAVLIGGPAGDRWSRRVVMLAGALVLCLGLVAISVTPFWIVTIGAIGIIGVGGGVVDSGTNALANDIAPPQGHAREQSILHSFFGIGALIGPLLVGAFLAAHSGWRGAYAVVAIGSVALVIMLFRLRLPDRPIGHPSVNLRSVLALATTPFVMVLALMMGVYIGAEILLGDWSATYLQRIHHLDKVAAATCVSLYWGGLAAGRLLSAAATRWFNGRTLLVLTCVLSLAATIALVVAQSTPVALFALTLSGLGYAAIFPLVMAVAGEVFPEATGTIAGLLIGAGSICGAAIPWAGGVLVQFSDARAALALSIPAGIIMVVISVVLLGYRPSRHASASMAVLVHGSPS
jgi:fucose permease